MISESTRVPLADPDSIINNIRSILEFCQRPEPEYCLLITDFEFAIRGMGNLLRISTRSRQDGERLVSSDTYQKIQDLRTFVVESNKNAWNIKMDEGILEWIISKAFE